VVVVARGNILLGHGLAYGSSTLTVVVGLLWPVPVGLGRSGSFLFMHGYSCVCSLVQNLTSLVTSSLQAPYKLLLQAPYKFCFQTCTRVVKNQTFT
jgi:hypothetical protein